MGDKTGIQWTDASWPVVNGCRRKSAGCEHCYAERLIATRLKNQPKYAGLATTTPDGPRWTGEARLWEEHLFWPLRWTRPRKIFVADMGDLFYEGVLQSDIDRVFAVMALAPRHRFQVLTKRPDRMRAYLTLPETRDRIVRAIRDVCADQCLRMGRGKKFRNADGEECYDASPSGMIEGIEKGWRWPLSHVWLGVSVEDQATADERIPLLLDTPAAVRFVSAEPLLGPVVFTEDTPEGLYSWLDGLVHTGMGTIGADDVDEPLRKLGWLIAGGESGPGARPCNVEWIGSIVDQCREAETPVFVKQLGAWPYRPDPDGLAIPHANNTLRLKDRKGGDMAEWPGPLRVREFPA